MAKSRGNTGWREYRAANFGLDICPCGKVGHRTRAMAEREIWAMISSGRDPTGDRAAWGLYRCRRSGLWHSGHCSNRRARA